MLTIIENLQRQMKRYNRKRGGALLMVLMTMAIIIVVGTSMLYITLSSFSTSIADTNQTKAYNAASTVAENVKNNKEAIIEVYEPTDTTPVVTLKFQNDASFSEADNYTLINGVKVSVTLSKAETTTAQGVIKTILVDVVGKYHNEVSQVSFTLDKTETYPNTQLENTYGNAFVINSSLGGEEKNKSLTFRRIEGDISINCYETMYDSSGNPIKVDNVVQQKMVTRYFNPVVMEGVTGSIFANGDLIIGSYDNVIKVQGNIYCDGNLTIRGLNLGANLPALYKKDYKSKYTKYTTIGHTTVAGFEILSTAEKIDRAGKGSIGEAMYKKIGDEYVPLQVYDEVSHYTLLDLFGKDVADGLFTFWTMNYETNADGVAEQVTIDFSKKSDDVYNKKFYGATMWYDEACTQPILQYPDGGNIYCTGDIIFDRANYGYVWVYSADGKDYKYKDLSYSDTDPVINQSYIDGDIYCLGRMIVSPENLTFRVKENGVVVDKNVVAMAFTTANGYLNKNTIRQQSVSTGSSVLGTIKSLFGISGGGNWTMDLNKDADGNPVLYTKDYSGGYRYYQDTYGETSLVTQGGYASKDSVAVDMNSFINSLKSHGSAGYATLKNKFISVVNGGVSSLINANYVYSSDCAGYLPDAGSYRSIQFNNSSNFYIYNWQYAGIADVGVEVARKLNSNSLVYETKTTAGCANTAISTVNGVSYDSALTIRMSKLDINSVYANGSINVIGIDNAFGYNYDAKLTANTIATTNAISSDYKELSLIDIVRYVNNLDSDEKAIDLIKKEYFGFTDTDSLFGGSGEVTYKINDGEKTDKNEIHNVIVLSYYTNYTLDITYKRDERDGNHHAWYKLSSYSYSCNADVRYWEYCYSGGSFYKFNGEKGKEVDDSEIASAFGISSDDVAVWKTKFATATFKYSDNAFLEKVPNQVLTDKAVEDRNIFLTNPKIIRPYCYTSSAWLFDRNDTGKNLNEDDNYWTDDSMKSKDPYVRKVVYRADLKTKETTDYDRFDISLGFSDVRDYIVNDFSEQLKMLGLVSTSDNKLNAILAGYGLTVGSNYNKEKTDFNVTDYSATAAFAGKYGMYLRSSLLDANPAVGVNANVSDIFLEMMDDQFALIIVQQTTQLTEPILRDLINENKDLSVKGIQEYDSFGYVSDDENPLYKVGEDSIYKPVLYNGQNNAYFTADNLFTLKGSVGALEWVDKTLNDVWFYTKTNSTSFAGRYYAIHNKSGKDNNIKVMKFSNTRTNMNTLAGNSNFKVVNSVGIDPLYITYDEDGNPLSGSKASKAFWNITTIRTQLDYTISGNVYFNFGGENGGYDTEVSAPVEFGASSQAGTNIIDTINNSKRMNIIVDTTQAGYNTKTGKNNDIYIYINAPCITYSYKAGEGDYKIVSYTPVDSGRGNFTFENNTYKDVGVGNGNYVGVYEYVGSGKGDYMRDAGVIFNKCSWRVKGTGNVYIMLVGNTSINANAYTLSLNLGGGVYSDQADRTDAMLGTHFYSDTYTTYVTKYTDPTVDKDAGYREIIATAVSTEDAGDLFIIGTGDNQMVVGRGGYINGFVYLPNGSYVNRSKGFLGILPNATSSYNQTTIVASHIAIEGSNIGNLIFQAFDIKAMGNSGSSNTTISFVDSNNDTKVIRWEFGNYYYN